MHVIVTMAGHSRRFTQAGYSGPKFLLPVGDAPMIRHVIDMFGAEDHFHFVLNENQVADNPGIEALLAGLARRARVVVIPCHEDGPTFSALQVAGIADDDEVIVTYCDFTVTWDYAAFLRHARGHDAAVPSFRGFHPASFGSTFYAYMRTDGTRMLELREKASFTEDRSQEHASVGIYYFRRWALFRDYGGRLLARKNRELPEAYVSLIFNDLVDDGFDVCIHEVEHFICLGTPEDYEQYQYWHRYHSKARTRSEGDVAAFSGQINMVPMAGAGNRFRQYGYRVAKPMIQVHGVPMVVRAAQSMPPAARWVFLPRAEDLARHPLERMLGRFFGDCATVPVPGLTSGQAATCMLAADLLPDEAPLMIASCDYEHLFDAVAWQAVLADPSIDGAVWTYRMGSGLVRNPNAFAYCRTAPDRRTITEVVEKRTISDSPGTDPLVVGTFWYRRAGDFKRGVEQMIAAGITVNGEHYVGTSINGLLAAGKRFVVFDVDQWISFGDPFELKVHEYWEDYFVVASGR